MKKVISILSLSLLIMLVACNKSDNSKTMEDEFKSLEADFELKGDGKYEKIITKPLVRLDDCRFIVEGTVEFYRGDELIVTIDFGDGVCDNIATKTVGDETTEFLLKRKKYNNSKYTKVIVEPLIRTDDCDYIVSGIVDFYSGDLWVATIDFGDGSCDEWATKIWDGGSKEFSLRKNKP